MGGGLGLRVLDGRGTTGCHVQVRGDRWCGHVYTFLRANRLDAYALLMAHVLAFALSITQDVVVLQPVNATSCALVPAQTGTTESGESTHTAFVGTTVASLPRVAACVAACVSLPSRRTHTVEHAQPRIARLLMLECLRIEHCGLNVRVAETVHQRHDVPTCLQPLGCSRVPESVR